MYVRHMPRLAEMKTHEERGESLIVKKIIEIHNLNKTFGDVKAVNNLSFWVGEGQLFAFLGVNGAGKSTAINIMCGQLPADSGDIMIDGYNALENGCETKRKLGVVFQNSVLDKALSVRDNLESRAALYGITGKNFEKRLKELALLLDFEGVLSRAVGKLSGGERRRVDIARSLLHKPRILILDEPTTGLDPQTRKLLWNVISELRRSENMTVFLTTHYMEEAADSNYVVILDGGRLVAEGTPIELKNKYTGDFITVYGKNESDIAILDIPYENIAGAFRLSVPDTATATSLIIKHPGLFTDYEVTKGKMDDVFINVTGKKLPGGVQQ